MDRQRRAGFLFVLPALVYFTAVFLLPLGESFLGSFYRTRPGGVSQFVGLRLYERVLTDPTFWQAVRNTVSLLLLSGPATVILALAVALGLNRFARVRWRSVWAVLYFLPFAVSLVAAALVWQWLYEPVYGFLNHLLGLVGIGPRKWLSSLGEVLPSLALVNVWVRLGFDTMIFLAALQAIPGEYYEAAAIDGAGALAELPVRDAPAAEPAARHGVDPGADLQLQGLRPGVRDHPGRTGEREPDRDHAALRHGLQVLPARGRVGHGRLRLRLPPAGHAGPVAALPAGGRSLKSDRWRWLTAALVAAGAITVFFPFFWMAVTSLKTVPEIQRVPLQILPDRWGNLDNYREVFARQPFGRFLLNSALIASVSAVSSLIVSSLAGYGFAKFRFPGRNLLFFAIIGILMVPFQSVVVPLYLWVSRLGLLDTYLGILAPDLVSVFGVFLMRQSIEVVPGDYIDAARIDGSSELGIFWRVILPAVRPALATLLIIKFMWTWNELFWPLVVINSPTMKVVTMGLVSFTNIYFIEYNLVTAAAVLSILPILAIFVVCQRWVVQAVVMSGLKG